MAKKRRWLAATLVGVVAAGAVGFAYLKRETAIADAERYARNGDWRRASELARPLSKSWLGSERALRVLAESASQRGDWTEAEKSLAALPNRTPDERLARAKLLSFLQRHQESADEWSNFAAVSPLAPKELLDFFEFLTKTERESYAFDLQLAFAGQPECRMPVAEAVLSERLMKLGFPREAARRIERPLQNLSPLPTAVRLRAARAFLAVGDSGRAELLLKESQPDSSDERAEKTWLLSRLSLQRGDAKDAAERLDELRALGAGYADRFLGKESEPATFVGAAECARCHEEKHQIQSTSSHASTLQRPNAKSMAKLPPVKDVADGIDKTLRFTLEPGTNGVAAQAVRSLQSPTASELKWQIGSGVHGISFIADCPGGVETEFSLSHYASKGWDVTTGHIDMGDRENPMGKPLHRLEGDRCIGCHATHVEALRQPEPGGRFHNDLGVRCETCHGPGGNHIKAVELGFKHDWAIRNPARMTAAASVEICAGCHQNTKNVDPLKLENVRFHSATLRASKCFTVSEKLSCTTCHDAHANKSRPAFEHGRRCLECHSRGALPCPPFKGHPTPSKPSDAEAASCIGCHMPLVGGAMKHVEFTDHRIRVHREGEKSQKTR
jgi:hypothetical protein